LIAAGRQLSTATGESQDGGVWAVGLRTDLTTAAPPSGRFITAEIRQNSAVFFSVSPRDIIIPVSSVAGQSVPCAPASLII